MYRYASFRLALTLVAAIALLPLSATAAFAQAPSNDDFGDAISISELPFTDMEDTTEATTASDDPDCVGNGPTVWYALTLDADTFVELNTFGSDYDTTLSAYIGERGTLEQIACNDDAAGTGQSRIRFDTTANETYYIMVGAFGSGPGGNLVLNALETEPSQPFHLDLTLDPVGNVSPKSGTAWISGTVTCSGADFVDLFGDLSQRAGRVIISGSGSDFLPCDGETPFLLEIQGHNGLFSGGRADAFVAAFACGEEECAEDFVEREVRLRGGGPR